MAKVRTNRGEGSERLIQRLQGEIKYLKRVLGMRVSREDEGRGKEGDLKVIFDFSIIVFVIILYECQRIQNSNKHDIFINEFDSCLKTNY
jgi:hypothetical protein